jgi:HD-like signal output (HDOD) protein
VGAIIEEDPGMSANVLQWVNSAYVGLPEQVSSAAEAAHFMGLEMVRALVLLVGVFSDEARAKLSRHFKIDALWKHSMMVGACSRSIYRTQVKDRKAAGEAFTAGLLHDAGKLVFATSCPAEYDQVIEVVERGEATDTQAELAMFGATHAEVGAYLLGLWGLPDPLVEAVAYHHRPRECLARRFGLLTSVHIANALDGAARYGSSGDLQEAAEGSETEGLPKLDRYYIGKLGLEELLPVAEEAYLGIGREDES